MTNQNGSNNEEEFNLTNATISSKGEALLKWFDEVAKEGESFKEFEEYYAKLISN